MPGAYGGKQLLHVVFGGEPKQIGGTAFRDLDALDIDGVYPNHGACEAKAQGSIDNAFTRHFVVHPRRLLEPEAKGSGSK